jgi:hypothetical protein
MSVTLSVDGRYFVTGVPKATRLQTLLARDAWYCMVWLVMHGIAWYGRETAASMVWQRDSCQGPVDSVTQSASAA